MRVFYDYCIQAGYLCTGFTLAVFLNNLLRFYPSLRQMIVVLFVAALPFLALAIYLPRYRVLGIAITVSLAIGSMVAWLT